MVEEISDSFSMVPLIAWIALDRFLGRRLYAGDLLADLAGRLRRLFGERLHLGRHDREAAAGLAGRAASMVAFSASRLVWPAMVLISSTTSPMRAAAFDNSLTRSLVVRACSTASLAIRADCCT